MKPQNVEAITRLSPMQEGILFHTLYEKETGLYCLRFASSLRGPLSIEDLHLAWDEVFARHGILRTSFHWEDLNKIVQVVHKQVSLPFEVEDWSHLPDLEQAAAWRDLCRSETHRGFDLSKAPISRFRLIRVADEDYRFLWICHHILIDGWSLAVILAEVFQIYRARTRGQQPALANARPFKDYVGWLQKADMSAAQVFFEKRFGDFTAPTPIGRRGAAAGASEGRSQRRETIGLRATRDLVTLARRQQLTINSLVQTAWALLLSRYSGESDVVFGATVSGRSAALPGIESMVGLFINTLPVRVRVDHSARLLPRLQRVQQHHSELLEFEFTPLHQVQGWSGTGRGTPLFDHILVFENYPIQDAVGREQGDSRDLTVEPEDSLEQINYALALIVQADDEIVVRANYDTADLDATEVERLLKQLRCVLEAMADQPDRLLSSLPWLTGAETHQALYAWNDTRQPLACGTLQSLFRSQAEKTPQAIAVVAGDGRLSYEEIGDEAGRWARRLRHAGVGRGTLVGVFLSRRWEMVPVLLGILEAGGLYVPFEFSFPAKRISWILSSLGIRHMVLDHQALDHLSADADGEGPESIDRFFCVDSERPEQTLPNFAQGRVVWPTVGEVEGPVHLPEVGPEDFAYYIFTSGSTGTPKGVMVRHQPVLNLIHWVNSTFEIGPLDRLLFVTSLCFDLSVYDIFGILAAGGTVRVASGRETRDPERLAQILAEEPVTFWDSAPAALQQLIPFLPRRAALERRQHLRLVFQSGDWVPLTLPEEMRQVFPNARVVALGGATEATVWSNFFPVSEVESRWNSIPYGRPIPNARYHVLDATLQPCGIGISGDLFIGGDCLAAGYAGAPQLTAWKFLPDAFTPTDGARLYRTGDRARFGSDGNIEFLGRLDHQVKVRGFRIELGEIESVLGEHPGVAESVVLAREDEPGRKQLVAYYLAASASEPPANDALRDYLTGLLPSYMVPAAFVMLETFPVTVNGKLDRKALPAPDVDRPAAVEILGPRTDVEEALVDIWQQLLRLEEVGVDENFFELGGDSILSIQLVSKAKKAGLRLNPRQVFEYPTVAELASVATLATTVLENDEPGSEPVGLTPAQHWFFEQDLTAPHHFNQSLFLASKRRLSVAHLIAAFEQLSHHHHALRLRFRRQSGRWQQVHAAPQEASSFTVIDLGLLSPAILKAHIETAANAVQGSLDLARGPLLRGVLFRLPDAADRLLLVCHHLVVDGVSWRILLEDLMLAHSQLESGKTIDLPARTTSFHRWTRLLAETAQSSETAAELAMWTAPERARVPALPRDRTPAADRSSEHSNTFVSVEHVDSSLSANATRALLREVPATYQTQIDDVLLAALGQAIAGWTGQRRCLVALEKHGRNELDDRIDLSRTVGWFTAFCPVLLELPQAADPGEVLLAVKDQLRAMPGDGFGYGLLRYLHPDADVQDSLRDLPQPELSFNYLGQVDLALGRETLFEAAPEFGGHGRAPQQRRRYLIEVDAHIVDGCLRTSWTYCPHLHDRATIEGLAEHTVAALNDLIRHCSSTASRRYSPSDFPLAMISQPRLDTLVRKLAGEDLSAELEALYPLSPLQQGLLFHSVFEPESGVYSIQLRCELDGALDGAVFRRAWTLLFARHQVLRTAFFWEGLDRPLQAVLPQVELPFEQLDWSAAAETQLEALFAARLESDLKQGFELSRAPLARLLLVRVAPDRHRFVLSLHHLLIDGWSLAQLIREAMALYSELAVGRSLDLPAPRPFVDYIAWLEQRDLEAASKFWQGHLEGVTEPGYLTSSAGGGSRSIPSERLPFAVRPEVSSGVATFARSQGLTVNVVLQGVWALLLSRYSGRREALFGITVAGRPPELDGVESMIGLFINTLPLRLEVDPKSVLVPWLLEVQQHQAEVMDFAFLSLTRVQELSSLPPGSELFDNILVFENYPTANASSAGAGSDGPDVTIRSMFSDERSSYAVSLVLGRDLEGSLIFDPARLEPRLAHRLIGHLGSLFEELVNNPSGRLEGLSMLNAAERSQLVAWSRAADAPAVSRSRPSLPDLPLHRLIAGAAERDPEAPSVIFGDLVLPYGELLSRSRRLAARLRSAGTGPETPVGLFLGRSVDMIVGMLAVLEAGGVYVPLDPEYPRQRLLQVLEDLSVWGGGRKPLLLTAETLIERLPEVEVEIILCDGDVDSDSLSEALVQPPSDEVLIDHAAYVIYTSGSTGRPKGVTVSHRNAVRSLSARLQVYSGRPVRFLLVPSFSFDSSIAPMFWTLVEGGCLVLPDEEAAKDGDALIDLIADHEITHWLSVPSLYSVILDFGAEDHARGGAVLESLRTVVVAGEACTRDLVQRHLDALPSADLYNEYGPTEASVWSSFHRFTAVDVAADPEPTEASARSMAGRPVTIGRAVPNWCLFVLDGQGQLMPPGLAGELFIGGEGVARGYLGRPSETASRFVPDSLSIVEGSTADGSVTGGRRLYRTGDRVRYREDGGLEFLGRFDQQVKIRGYRIELAEIEAVLQEQPAVVQAAVLAHDDSSARTRLVAYVVARVLDEQTLRQVLAEQLPNYMVPDRIVLLEALPLLPNGKVDRQRLPRLSAEQRRQPIARATPMIGPAEELVLAVFRPLLEVPELGPDDDFFAFGGHSLLAMRAVSQLGRVFGTKVSLRTLFEAPTARAIAAEVQVANGMSEVTPLIPVDRTGELPLSFAQQRMWFLDRLDPASSAYNVPMAVRLRGGLDPTALQSCLELLTERQEVLRTSFPDASAERVPVQRIASRARLWGRVDLRRLESADRPAAARNLAVVETRAPFDLSHGPLLRMRLVQLSEDDHAIVLTAHHIIFDAWSMAVFIRELSELYVAWTEGRAAELPTLTIQYADYAVWQRQMLKRQGLESQLAYWTERLGGDLPVLSLATDGLPETTDDARGGVVSRRLDGARVSALLELGQGEGSTLFMTFLALFSLLLSRLSNQDDIIVGVPIAGRQHAGTESLIGCFLNTLALRCDLSQAPTFLELLGQVRRRVLEAYEHQDVPFEQIVERVQPRRDLHRSPIFEVLLNVMDNVDRSVADAGRPANFLGLESEALAASDPEAKLLLSLEVIRSGGEIDLQLVFQRQRLAEQRAEELLDQLVGLVTQAVEGPEQKVATYSLLTPSASALVADPELALSEPKFPPVAHAILDRARRSSTAIALRQGELSWNYGTLATHALEVVARLRDQGFVPGDTVVVEGERRAELVAAVLGILAGGGVLLTMDPQLPGRRKRWMLEHTRARHRVVIAGSEVEATWLDGLEVDTLELSGMGEASSEISSVDLPSLEPDAPAYIFFTSGTSGVPKAVVGQQRSLAHFLNWQRDTFEVTDRDRVPLLSGLAFDAVLRDILLPLISGGELHLPVRALAPDDVIPWMRVEGITLLHSVPSVVRSWLAMSQAASGETSIDSLRWTFFSGEPLEADLVAAWRRTAGSTGKVVNFYGPTETTMIRCFHVIEEQPELGVQMAGRALPQSQALVLAPGGQLCGLGEVGEIYLRTPFRTLGYLGQATETRRWFIPNPWRQDPTDLLYRTGDLGRYQLNGGLEILGRLDDQVKIRGVRIEPAEIGEVLARHEGVRQCFVLAKPGVGGLDGTLVGYVARRHDVELEVDDLRRHLGERLPAAMVPGIWQFVEKFELTPSGKIDRQALPVPEQTVDSPKRRVVAPRDDLEMRLVGIWEQVLEVSPIGVTESFFDLGGHSLLGVRLLAQIHSELGRELPMVSLFTAGTVESQAALLGQGEALGSTSLLVPIQPQGEESPIFWIHPGRGGVLCYHELARALGRERPFWALRARGHELGEDPSASVEEMATLYLEEIRTVQNQGPFHLAGWSFGGLVAFEMALRLRGEGEEVAFLGILDTFMPDSYHLQGNSSGPMQTVLDEIERLEGQELMNLVAKAKQQNMLPPEFSEDDAMRLARLTAAHQTAGHHYSPQIYTGPVTFFKAQEPLPEMKDAITGWQGIAPGLKVIEIPGNHYSMIETPRVDRLATELERSLDNLNIVCGEPAEVWS